MPLPRSSWSGHLARQAHAAYVVAKKDAIIYYLKPPVISFGVVFPLFFYLAFAAGRNLPADAMVPGIVAMALFFTASAVGPLVTPWERQARTWERLVTSPASICFRRGPTSTRCGARSGWCSRTSISIRI